MAIDITSNYLSDNCMRNDLAENRLIIIEVKTLSMNKIEDILHASEN